MKVNRRNTLLALGTIAAGSGTVLATGAFSSLSADRTVTINTASDSDAVLSLKLDEDNEYSGLNDGGTDVILLDFDQLNQNSVTTFVGALEIGNNGSQEVDVTINSNGNVLGFSGVPEDLGPGESKSVTIIVDLNSVDDAPEEITIRAET